MGCEFAEGQVLLQGSSWNSGPHIRTHPKSEYPPGVKQYEKSNFNDKVPAQHPPLVSL